MRRSKADRRRGGAPADWNWAKIGLRIAFVLILAVALSIIVLRSSVAEVFQASNPARALAWQPTHAGAKAAIAQRLVAADRIDDARQLAVEAVARDVMEAGAYSALGLLAERAGQDGQALRYMSLAHAMSRREPQNQIWFIRRSIREGDFEAAVRHFDIAMRTSSRRSADLMPLLVTASVDPRLIPPLSSVLAREPVWKVAFLRNLVETGRSPANLVRLTLGHLNPAVVEERTILARLIHRLAAESQFDLAWLVYRSMRPGTPDQRAASLRGGGFAAIGDLPPFDWQLTNDPELTAAREVRQDRPGDYALALMAGGGRTGEVARQLLRLTPGRYVLQFEVGAVPAAESDRPRISVICAPENVIATFRPNSGWNDANRVAMPFAVPPGCRWQWLSISISSNANPERYPWIDNIAIRVAGQ